jgi:hypothetical protein
MSAHLAVGAAAALAGLAALRGRQGSRAAVSPLEFVEGEGGLHMAWVSTLAGYRWLPDYRDQSLVQIELVRRRLPPVARSQGGAERRFRDGLTVGYIQAVVTRWNIWEIEAVEAKHGYGPLLYDLLMELALWSGAAGVTPDRSGVSSDAEQVWDHYAERRPDVEASPLPEDYPDRHKHSLRHRPNLDRVYSRSGVDGLRLLERERRLDILDPENVLDLDDELLRHDVRALVGEEG